MQILNIGKNCLGTASFTLKLGKMKKAEEFVTYPIQRDDPAQTLRLQSSHRWGELDTKTGAVILSARRAQYANSWYLIECKIKGTAEYDNATPEQLAQMLEAVRGTASPMAGGNNCLAMYCDNSNAAMV